MESKELIDLYEAYTQVYASHEIAEEVEIAAQYFYEIGLNEEGVDIVIEELGLEEFIDWVYDISENYTLTEARAGGVRVEPVTTKGKKFKSGKPTGKSLDRLRAQKAARREAEEKASAAKPSGLKASLKRQSAVANAQKKQPEKSGTAKGIAGRIGAALGSAVKKAKSDIELTKKTAQTVRKAVGTGIEAMNRASDTRLARQARVATHKGVKRHTQALKSAGGALGKTLGASTARRRSQTEDFELWVNSLVEEGYDLSEYTLDDMYEIYVTERREYDEPGEPKRTQHMRLADPSQYEKDMKFWQDKNRKSSAQFRMKKKGTVPQKGGKDMFEHIINYLIDEGYADTNQAAVAIMANMSEDWKQSILGEEKKELPQTKMYRKAGELAR